MSTMTPAQMVARIAELEAAVAANAAKRVSAPRQARPVWAGSPVTNLEDSLGDLQSATGSLQRAIKESRIHPYSPLIVENLNNAVIRVAKNLTAVKIAPAGDREDKRTNSAEVVATVTAEVALAKSLVEAAKVVLADSDQARLLAEQLAKSAAARAAKVA